MKQDLQNERSGVSCPMEQVPPSRVKDFRRASRPGDSRFTAYKLGTYAIAEFTLEKVLLLSDALEEDNFSLAAEIIHRNADLAVMIRANTALSYQAVLEITSAMKNSSGTELQSNATPSITNVNPLHFVLSGIRITSYLHQMGNFSAHCAGIFLRKNMPKKIFSSDTKLNIILSRLVTSVGIAIEHFVEEKARTFGLISKITRENREDCISYFSSSMHKKRLERKAFTDLSFTLHNFVNISDAALIITKESKAIFS